MSDELESAAAALSDARERCEADAHRERLEGLEDQLSTLAGGGRGADHGRLARIQAAIGEVREAAPEAADALAEADDLIDAYRETVEGV